MESNDREVVINSEATNNIARNADNISGDTVNNIESLPRNNTMELLLKNEYKTSVGLGLARAQPASQPASQNYSEFSFDSQVFSSDNYKILLKKSEIHSKLFGNRCGHLPEIPSAFISPSNHKKRYPIIEQAKRNLTESYFNPLKYLAGKLFYHQDKQTAKAAFRKRRSEARESLTHRIGQVILHYTNLETMMLGHPDSKTLQFIHYGVKFIAEKAQTTLIRAKRTLKIFKDCMYIKINRRRVKQVDGTFKDLPAEIHVNPEFYLHLGITEEDLIAYRYKQNKRIWREVAREKAKSIELDAKLQKREAKLEKRQEKRSEKRHGAEMPGSERKRELSPLYRDYTGISQDREGVLARNEPSPVAKHFLQSILSKLRPNTS